VDYRECSPERDKDAVLRIFREVGWLSDDNQKAYELLMQSAPGLVADIDGTAECLASWSPGTIRHLSDELPFSGIGAVATSHLARKQGLGGRLTAAAVARAATEGAAVVGLGIFDQGYYNQLGFGNGAYERWFLFDPAILHLTVKHSVPQRLSIEDWQDIHALRRRRAQGHGAVNFTDPEFTREGMIERKNAFGLGYRDEAGTLTHCLWITADDLNHGPYVVEMALYREPEQLLELLALLKSLSDQVYLTWLREPPGIQMQDLLDKPFRNRRVRERGKFAQECRTEATWQVRICDLPACLERTHLYLGPVRFNLQLTDPIDGYVPQEEDWRGIGGDYIVTLGHDSSARPGSDASLPTLAASTNAFTRMWLGVRPATGLSVTDDLSGPAALLADLDEVLLLPEPRPDWAF